MKTPWIKLHNGYIRDEKIHFIIKKNGHDCNTFWTCLLTECDNGILELDEDLFADMIMIEDDRFNDIKNIFIKYNLIHLNKENKISVTNWSKYQFSDSYERVIKVRDKQKKTVISRNEDETKNNNSVTTEKQNCNANETFCNAVVTDEKHFCNTVVTTEEEEEEEEEEEYDANASYRASAIFQKLKDEGLSKTQADKIIKDHHPKYILDKLDQANWLISNKPEKIKNKQGYILKSILEDWPYDNDYMNRDKPPPPLNDKYQYKVNRIIKKYRDLTGINAEYDKVREAYLKIQFPDIDLLCSFLTQLYDDNDMILLNEKLEDIITNEPLIQKAKDKMYQNSLELKINFMQNQNNQSCLSCK